MNYSIKTFGCKVSQYESQSIREAWQKQNYQETKEEHADILLLASCAVTREGVTDARQLCNKWRKLYPNSHIIITGCAAEIAKDDFKNANAIIPQKMREILLTENPKNLLGYYEVVKSNNFPAFSIQDFKRSRPVIKVQDGCSHVCSYCIVPYCRGGSKSRNYKDIIEEIQILLEKGFREFVLSGVNLRQYSYNDFDFWDILKILQEKFAKDWENKARFRLSSLEPAQLNTKGIEVLTLSNMIAPHIHLSLQSGSQTVLERMKREHYLLKDIHHSLNELQKKWKNFGLGADFLLGFPEESEEEFQETISFINEIDLTYSHVFPYSPRPHTPASKYDGQIEKHIKKERTALVRNLIDKKQEKFMQKILKEEKVCISLDIPDEKDFYEGKTFEALDQYYNACTLEYSSVLDNHLKNNLHDLLEVKISNLKDNKFKIKIS